nr:hypothetical protein [Hoylesella shahii]
MKNNGICYGSDYTRYSARLKSEYQARKWMTVGGNISYTHSESNASGNAFGAAHQIPPIYLYICATDKATFCKTATETCMTMVMAR